MTSDPRDARIAELEEQTRRLERALSEQQALASVGEITSSAAHEFNNLLTVSINYATMGMRHRDDKTRDQAFEKILDVSNRAAKIVAVILGQARNRKPGFEPTDLGKLADDVLLLLERENTKFRIAVERKYQDPPKALVNGNQIQQVLLNLLVNARQAYGARGGRVVVKIRPKPDDPKYVEISVRDYGCGIPREKLPKIFDMFYTTKDGPDASGKGGNGLGLALCKRIVEAHNGKIRVESAEGKGTAFIISLPAAPKSDGAA